MEKEDGKWNAEEQDRSHEKKRKKRQRDKKQKVEREDGGAGGDVIPTVSVAIAKKVESDLGMVTGKENGKRNDEEQDRGHEKKRKKVKRDKEQQLELEDGGGGGDAIPTVSVAIAGSIIDNAQSLELATLLAGQIARAVTIFRIDEVVVFDNKADSVGVSTITAADDSTDAESGSQFLMRILQYLETPQYLRRSLFPMHNSLRFVGLLPPLDAPHHVRKHEWSPFREGITLQGRDTNSKGTLVNVGLSKNSVVDQILEPGVRVTVAMGINRDSEADSTKKVVPSTSPREEKGLYWGYKVRYASNISSVLKQSPYKGGYDHIIGTSEHGCVINSSELALPKFRHLLIAFGGLAGLEESIEEDNELKGKNVREIFGSYLNTCPNQGSRTIRSEEAIFISLQYFQEPIARVMQRLKNS